MSEDANEIFDRRVTGMRLANEIQEEIYNLTKDRYYKLTDFVEDEKYQVLLKKLLEALLNTKAYVEYKDLERRVIRMTEDLRLDSATLQEMNVRLNELIQSFAGTELLPTGSILDTDRSGKGNITSSNQSSARDHGIGIASEPIRDAEGKFND